MTEEMNRQLKFGIMPGFAALCDMRDARTVAANRGVSVEKVFRG